VARDLLPGDVILVQGSGFVDSVIRFGQRKTHKGWIYAIKKWRKKEVDPTEPTSVAHCAVYVGNGFLIEALAGGLTLSPLSKYDNQPHLIAHLATAYPDVTDHGRQQLVLFARESLKRHDSYGWLSIMSIIGEMITPMKFDISWDGAIICSAFAAQCWEHAGMILSTASSLTTVPADIAIMAGY
jgi:hypothetical protein